VSHEGVFGEQHDALMYAPNAGLSMYQQMGVAQTSTARVSRGVASGVGAGSGAGVGTGQGGGTGGGVYAYKMAAPPPPPRVSQPMMVAGAEDTAPSVPAEEKPTGERAMLESKLHPALLEAFDCWKKSGQDCKLVKDGTVEVQLWLTDDSSAVLEQLNALGFITSHARQKDKVLVGRLPTEKLADLAKISAVRFASPVRR